MLRHVVWLWKKLGGPREEIMNGKRAGPWRDAHEWIAKFAEDDQAEVGAKRYRSGVMRLTRQRRRITPVPA
jgi:hypothetical protein